MKKISGIVLVRNEEILIERCLLSLKQLCDEIIVIDMESNDRTVEIAKRYTDKILSHPLILEFDSARYKGLGAADGNWIIYLDADEVIPETLIKKLKEIANKNLADVVKIPRKSIFFNKFMRNSVSWPDYQTRFFKKGFYDLPIEIHDKGCIKEGARTLELEPNESLAIFHERPITFEKYIHKLNNYVSAESDEMFLRGVNKKTFLHPARPAKKHERGENINFNPLSIITEIISYFLNRWFVKKYYKDGLHGFALLLMELIYRISIWVKIWMRMEESKQ